VRFRATLESELLNTNLNAKCSEYKLQKKPNSFSVSITIFVQILYFEVNKKERDTSGLSRFAWASEPTWASYIQT